MRDFATSADFANGVMTWKSNGRVPFDDMLEAALAEGFPVDLTKSAAERDRQNTAFLRAYRANPPKLTAEDLAEARAAHGPGVTLVNIVTGRKFVT